MGRGLPATDRYGLGLWLTRRFGLLPAAPRGGPLEGHNGEYPGYTADAFATPDGRRGFALLISTDALTPAQQRIVTRLARVLAC